MSNVSPLAVLRPSKTEPYHEAIPRMTFQRGLGTTLVGWEITGVADWTLESAVATGLGSRASACTVRVEIVPTIPATATQKVPAISQNCTGFLGLMLVAFGRISIF
jgi:hypothetical protein